MKTGACIFLSGLMGAICFPYSSFASPEIEEPVNLLRKSLRHRIENGDLEDRLIIRGSKMHSPGLVLSFYEHRVYEPAWTSDGGLLPLAELLHETISAADLEGLNPKDYHQAMLESIIKEASETERRLPLPWIIDAEILCTDAALTLAAHYLSGRSHPLTFDPEWFASPRRADLISILHDAIESEELEAAFRGLLPRQKGYWRLRKGQARYRRILKEGDSSEFREAAGLKKGGRGKEVRLLKRRLVLEGELTVPDREDDTFDGAVESAVKSFQARHGLPRSGVIDKTTLLELSVPLEDKIKKIKANLERWRWLPASMGERHVRVNLANFDLDFIEKGRSSLSMRVVIGKAYRRTPVFSDNITYLVFNPSWTVPPRVAAEDELPKIRGEKDYFITRKARVYEGWETGSREIDPATINWEAVSARNFNYRLKHGPSPHNPLGRVKFMFPNAHDIYLHDSPYQEKFLPEERAFSSGCIRLENPFALAAKLLQGHEDWGGVDIETAVEDGNERTIRLPKPVPVHILYWTAWADARGSIHFRKDIYDRDARIQSSLAEAL